MPSPPEDVNPVAIKAEAEFKLSKIVPSALLVWGFWFVLVVYGFWFLFRAKTFQFLTLDDLALTWRLHKQLAGCKASRIHSLVMKKNVVVGFRCDCGYEFIQERLITQTTHKYPEFRLPRLMPSKGNALPIARGSS